MATTRNPETREQWQSAVDAAHGMLAIDSARKYGLISGGPVINLDRCEEILEAGRRQGIRPANDAVKRLVTDLIAAGKVERPNSR